MSEMFLAYRGQRLEISEPFDLALRQAKPWIDAHEVYESIDLWLIAHPKRRGTMRFVVGWINRISKPKRLMEAEVGKGPSDYAQVHVREAIRERESKRK